MVLTTPPELLNSGDVSSVTQSRVQHCITCIMVMYPVWHSPASSIVLPMYWWCIQCDTVRCPALYYLYSGDVSSVTMQNSHCGLGAQTPHPHTLVHAAGGKQRVLLVDSHVSDLSSVTTQGGHQSSTAGMPDLYQRVICSLQTRWEKSEGKLNAQNDEKDSLHLE